MLYFSLKSQQLEGVHMSNEKTVTLNGINYTWTTSGWTEAGELSTSAFKDWYKIEGRKKTYASKRVSQLERWRGVVYQRQNTWRVYIINSEKKKIYLDEEPTSLYDAILSCNTLLKNYCTFEERRRAAAEERRNETFFFSYGTGKISASNKEIIDPNTEMYERENTDFLLLDGCWQNERVTIEINLTNKTYTRILKKERLVKILTLVSFSYAIAEIKSGETIIDVTVKDNNTITLAKRGCNPLLFTRKILSNNNIPNSGNTESLRISPSLIVDTPSELSSEHVFQSEICTKCGCSKGAVEYFGWKCEIQGQAKSITRTDNIENNTANSDVKPVMRVKTVHPSIKALGYKFSWHVTKTYFGEIQRICTGHGLIAFVFCINLSNWDAEFTSDRAIDLPKRKVFSSREDAVVWAENELEKLQLVYAQAEAPILEPILKRYYYEEEDDSFEISRTWLETKRMQQEVQDDYYFETPEFDD